MATSYSTPPMEQEVQPPTLVVAPAPAPNDNTQTPKHHRRAMSSMLSTLFVSTDQVRSPSKKPSKKPADTGPGFLAKFLCGLHPLHHAQFEDDDDMLPERRMSMMPIRRTKSECCFHDVLLPPPSPDHVMTVVEEGMSSQYASAEDLQALDNNSEEEERGSNVNNGIDLQAEEFIAKFYTQMRLQRNDSVEQS